MKTEEFKIPTGTNGVDLFAVLSSPDESLDAEKDKTLVIMAHDIPFSHSGDHANLFSFLRSAFDDHGLQTLIFDFESYGNSGGWEETFTLETAQRNLHLIIDWARHKDFENFIFVAAGVSAALCLDCADDSTKCVFLFWPVIDLATFGQNLLSENPATEGGRAIAPSLVEQMKDYNLFPTTKSLKIPILIQYGTKGDDTTESAQIDLIKAHFHALRLDITSYLDGGPGLTDPRHRKMIGHHVDQFLHKYA